MQEESFDSTSLELGKEVEITKVSITIALWFHFDVCRDVSPATFYQLDWLKIEVMNWLMFEETQRAEAIRQGNALIRAFLGMAYTPVYFCYFNSC